MKLFRKKKNTKTNFLSSKVISVNDMLWHTFKFIRDYRVDTFMEKHTINERINPESEYSIEELRLYINNCLYEGLEPIGGNIIILLTFSDNYLYDCAELLSASSSLITNFKSVSNDAGRIKLLKHKDKDGVSTKIGRANVNTNYLLLSGDAYDLIQLFYNINSLANPLLEEISNVIYENIDHSLFKKLIDSGILQLDKFKSFYEPLLIPKHVITNDEYNFYIADFDNVDDILSMLPQAFSSVEIAKMFTVSLECKTDKYTYKEYSLYNLVYDLFDNTSDDNIVKQFIECVNTSKIYYDNIVKGAYKIRDMEDIIKPMYDISIDDDDLITGKSEDIDEEYINEIKGANVYSPLLENQSELIDIDEELSEDDPEYNQVDEELKK